MAAYQAQQQLVGQFASKADFLVQLQRLDGTPLDHTQVGDKIYVAGVEGEAFQIYVQHTAAYKLQQQPSISGNTKIVAASLEVDGVFHRLQLNDDCSRAFRIMKTLMWSIFFFLLISKASFTTTL